MDLEEFENIISNSDNYLKNKMKNAYSTLLLDSQCVEDLKRKNSILYSKEFEIYDKIMDNSILAINDILGEKNIFTYFILFSYLSWNGYFSTNKIFSYKEDIFDYISCSENLNMISGFGNCRVLTRHLNYFYKKLNINSIFFINDIKTTLITKNIPIDRYADGKLVISPKLNLINLFNTKTNNGTHVSSLVRYNKNFYVLDPTNLAIFKVIDENNIKRYNAIGKSIIAPWGLIVYNNMKLDDIQKLFKKFKNNDNSFIKQKELNEFINYSIEIATRNKEILDDLFLENEENINELNKLLIKKK